MKPPSQHERKLVRAKHNFTGSSDELTFKVGDEITVIHEVLDDWWLGALSDGRKGLFPATYTETISLSSSSYQGSLQSSDDLHRSTVGEDSEDDIGNLLKGRVMGTGHPSSGRLGYGFDAESITSTVPEDEEETRLVPIKVIEDEVFYTPRSSSPQPLPPSISGSRSTSDLKRTPPLPPPRRQTNPPTAPPLPCRKPVKNQSQTNSPSPAASAYLTPSSSVNSVPRLDVSPFDSLLDVSSA
jgi:hypothetical protein